MIKNSQVKKSYAELNDKLGDIIGWFESSEINIDEALPKYEEAMKIIEQMEDQLKTMQNKIKKINARFK